MVQRSESESMKLGSHVVRRSRSLTRMPHSVEKIRRFSSVSNLLAGETPFVYRSSSQPPSHELMSEYFSDYRTKFNPRYELNVGPQHFWPVTYRYPRSFTIPYYTNFPYSYSWPNHNWYNPPRRNYNVEEADAVHWRKYQNPMRPYVDMNHRPYYRYYYDSFYPWGSSAWWKRRFGDYSHLYPENSHYVPRFNYYSYSL